MNGLIVGGIGMLLIAGFSAPGVRAAGEKAYDPLALKGEGAEGIDCSVHDGERDREIPIKVYLPEGKKKAPVVLFSHGLGGSRENNAYLGRHWSARGYAVVAMQHAGSDSEVWRGVPLKERLGAMKAAASGEAFLARTGDVPAVLDQLEAWNAEKGHDFEGRFDLSRVGMSGHSFGAVTTQAVSGQSFGRQGTVYTDARIDAAVAFSPSTPSVGDAAEAFSKVEIPWLLMTGTKDESVIGRTTPEQRREVYRLVPPGEKYELVLDGAEHMAFSDRTLLGREQRNPNHHRVILALSTAFWDSYLKGDEKAREWLDGEGAKALLDEKDVWQRK